MDKPNMHESSISPALPTDVLPVPATPGLDEAHDIIAAATAMMQNEEVRKTVGSLLAFRRGYAVAVRVLEEQVAAHKLPESIAIGVVTHFTAAIAQALDQPFDEKVLLRGFPETVFPWMSQVVGRHSQTEVETRREEFEAVEKSRRERPFVLPVEWGCEVDPQPRSRTLLVVGAKDVVRWAMSKIYGSLAKSKETPSWCFVNLTYKPSVSSFKDLIQVPVKAWCGCGNSNSSMARFAEAHLTEQLSRPVDMLLVDELALTVNNLNTFASVSVMARKGEKRLRDWADAVGCGVVGGYFTVVPVRPPAFDGVFAEWTKHMDVLRVWREITDAEGEINVYCQLDRGDGTARRGAFIDSVSDEALRMFIPKLVLEELI